LSKSRLISIFVAALALALPAGAQAAAITLGSPGLPESSSGAGGPSTLVQRTLADPSATVVSPVDGVITKWRIRASYGPGGKDGFALRVLRFNGGSSFTGMGSSAPEKLLSLSAKVETFPTHIPISAGEYIGINLPSQGYVRYLSGQGTAARFEPPLGDGVTGTSLPELPNELDFNADVLPAPTIAEVVSSSGAGGETIVGISGADFEEVEAVTFGGTPFEGITLGGTPAASYSVKSDSLITAVVPATAPGGTLNVAVKTAAGIASSSFDYGGPPTAAGLTPTSTPAPCTVPKLKGKKLKASKKKLRAADCRIGKVKKKRGATAKTGRVVKERPKPGKTLAPGAKVTVTLGV
jgi:hypothetical protein